MDPQQHQQGHLDFSQDSLLPIDSTFDSSKPTSSAFYFPDSATWPLLVHQNMSQQPGGITSGDSNSRSNPLSSSQPGGLDVRSSLSSPMTALHSPSAFDTASTRGDEINSTAPLGVSPQMATSMATLHLAGFNGVSGAENVSGQPVTLDIRTSMANSMAPLQTTDLGALQHAFNASATMLATASMPFNMPMLSDQPLYNTGSGYTSHYDVPLHSSPTDEFIATTQEQHIHGLSSLLIPGSMDGMGRIDSLASPTTQFGYPGLPDLNAANWASLLGGELPSDFVTNAYGNPTMSASADQSHFLGSRSLSNRSDNSWTIIDNPRHSLDSFSDGSAVVSPQILHVRTDSNSSQHSDHPPLSAHSFGSHDEPLFPISPEPEAHPQPHGLSNMNYDNTFSSRPSQSPLQQPIHSHAHAQAHAHTHAHSHSQAHTNTPAGPSSRSPRSSSGSSTGGSPKTRRRTSPPGVTAKTIAKKKAPAASASDKPEKRVGRRRGPLRPEQRQQAHEIRKLRACLRCKFLKKVCDKGDPCGGCQPSHARLWQVPCTRIDIKDIGYFLKDWNADYERHVTLGFSIANIKGFSQEERILYVTHGYGFVMPIAVRQVHVHDESVFGVDFIETQDRDDLKSHELVTAKLSAGVDGISRKLISEYIELHLENGFDNFVDNYFSGTLFVSELLKTIHRYYLMTRQSNIRKGLKLVIAYALTLNITLITGLSEEESQIGKIDDPTSRYHGSTCAPVMINFQVKKAMADMWRELMKDVLEELSALYSSVYNGEKFKNWPTIFMLIALILSVWEMIQFDCHYRVPDEGAVTNFCNEMETVPVGVIVGLFNAISTKLPTFLEWDSRKHGSTWDSNPAVCETFTQVRTHVEKHEPYLKTRNEAKFDRDDFDSLSNKFLSKLVIRAN